MLIQQHCQNSYIETTCLLQLILRIILLFLRLMSQSKILNGIGEVFRKTFRIPAKQPTTDKKPVSKSKKNTPRENQARHSSPACTNQPVHPYSQPFASTAPIPANLILIQPLLKCADRLVGLVDCQQAEPVIKQYVWQREKLLNELTNQQSPPHSVSMFQVNRTEETVQKVNLELVAELSRLKIKLDDKQEALDTAEAQIADLQSELQEINQLFSFEEGRLQKEKEKVKHSEYQLERIKGVLRKIANYQEIEQYFWALEAPSPKPAILQTIQTHQLAIINTHEQISSAWLQQQQLSAMRRRSNRKEP